MNDTNFRNYLRGELVSRCKRNPQYSLRGFARSLDVDPSTLSKILSGKRPIGKKTILQLGPKAGLSQAELKKYLKPTKGAESEAGVETSFQQLALDQFAIIADWYHFAILELMAVEGFSGDRKWIARSLNIRPVEVDLAIERLVRVGMLEITPSGEWIDKSSGITTNIGPDMSSAAHKLMQQQFLEKAIAALTTVSNEDRDHSAMTMAIDKRKLPEARERIRKFRRSLAVFLNDGDSRDEVFNLNIVLFPISQIKRDAKPQTKQKIRR